MACFGDGPEGLVHRPTGAVLHDIAELPVNTRPCRLDFHEVVAELAEPTNPVRAVRCPTGGEDQATGVHGRRPNGIADGERFLDAPPSGEHPRGTRFSVPGPVRPRMDPTPTT